MQNWTHKLGWYANKDLEHRRSWYSSVAEAYSRTRPQYPAAAVQRVVELTQLTTDSHILELGCGPGTATAAFAPLGCPILALEPSPGTFDLAQRNCAPYPNIQLLNTTFEEWGLTPAAFDVVLAATSFHWLSAEVRHQKSAAALRQNGFLVLLWNTEVLPQAPVRLILEEVYQQHAPTMLRYESKQDRSESLKLLGQGAIASGYFTDLHYEEQEYYLTYSTSDYLTVLGTYSPYMSLEAEQRDALFAGLQEKIDNQCEGQVHLSYLSAFHIARKRDSL
jgi:SAM-dependent methyltransferase